MHGADVPPPWNAKSAIKARASSQMLYIQALMLHLLAGHTPLLALHSLTEPGSETRIAAKLEGFNPQGSVKDR